MENARIRMFLKTIARESNTLRLLRDDPERIKQKFGLNDEELETLRSADLLRSGEMEAPRSRGSRPRSAMPGREALDALDAAGTGTFVPPGTTVPPPTTRPPGTTAPPQGDPLTAGIPLVFGDKDVPGGTVHQNGTPVLDPHGNPVTVQLIGPLQQALRSFGYGITATLTAVFDIPTRHAVREFQREAKTTTTRMSGGVVVTATGAPFTGNISGQADLATLAEMLVWRTNNYRSMTSFLIVTGSGTTTKTTNDVGYSSADIDQARVFALQATNPRVRFASVTHAKTSYGLTNTQGVPLTTVLTDPAQAANFTGATWEKRAICEVVFNEARVFEALNTYDNAFLSVGLFQWTLGPTPDPAELAGICSVLAAADFARLFGQWGLALTSVTGKLDSSLFTGQFSLDGTVLTQDVKAEFRSFHWAYRFFIASQDPVFRQTQYRNALSRLRIVVGLGLTFAGSAITAGQLLQSEFLRAVALDQHVNRPGQTPGALQDCANAFHDPTLLDPNSTAPNALATKWQSKLKRPLAPAEKQRLQDLQTACNSASTSGLAVTGPGTLATMSQAQHDAFASLYKWWRENLGTMTDAATRWASIQTGGHTGTLGSLSKVPGVFTP